LEGDETMSKIKNACRPVIAYIKALAKDEFWCRVYYDVQWENGRCHRYLRIKGRRAHDPVLVNVVKEKFPAARVYLTKSSWVGNGEPTPAISITIPRIEFERALIDVRDIPTRIEAVREYARWMRAEAYPKFEEDRVIRRFRLIRTTQYVQSTERRNLGLYTITFMPYIPDHIDGYYLIKPEVK